MSAKCQFRTDLLRQIASMGGSHLTREARERTARRFVLIMARCGFSHLASAVDVRGRHIRAYVADRRRRGLNVRSLQNELSHLRAILRWAGSTAVVDAPELSNRGLGISGGSRLGTKRAPADDELRAILDRAEALGRPGIRACLALEDALGLRRTEAVRADVDVLLRWLREIPQGQIEIFEGAKGGRRRFTRIVDPTHATNVVQDAVSVAMAHGQYLIADAKGGEGISLKSALAIYRSWCARCGFQSHALRYRWAQRQYQWYRDQQLSEREARRAVASDLGHGQGRGRYVASVYCLPLLRKRSS